MTAHVFFFFLHFIAGGRRGRQRHYHVEQVWLTEAEIKFSVQWRDDIKYFIFRVNFRVNVHEWNINTCFLCYMVVFYCISPLLKHFLHPHVELIGWKISLALLFKLAYYVAASLSSKWIILLWKLKIVLMHLTFVSYHKSLYFNADLKLWCTSMPFSCSTFSFLLMAS